MPIRGRAVRRDLGVTWACKEKTRADKYGSIRTPLRVGDAYCFTALERGSKADAGVAPGDTLEALDTDRTSPASWRQATTGQFQVTTDGFKPYQTAIPNALPFEGATFAVLIKQYATKDG